MAGRGPAPKDAKLRQRTNKKATAAELFAPENPEIPALPANREWHVHTVEWWRNVWSSPMSSEFLDTDKDGLARLAVLVDEFNINDATTTRLDLMKEIRMQEARFGLTPVDRARLHWEVAKGEEAERKRQKPVLPQREKPKRDPRDALH